jgi:hypothetical protein
MAISGHLPKKSQRFAHPLVRAGHGHGDPGTVANVPICPRQNLNRTRLGTLGDRGQIADHTAGCVSQSQMDRPVQILDDFT